MAIPLRAGPTQTGHPNSGIETLWAKCGGSFYPQPTATALTFYGLEILIAILVITLWAKGRGNQSPGEL